MTHGSHRPLTCVADDEQRGGVFALLMAMSATGWDDVRRTFEWVASTYSDCESFDLDIIAAPASAAARATKIRRTTPTSIHSGTTLSCIWSKMREGSWENGSAWGSERVEGLVLFIVSRA